MDGLGHLTKVCEVTAGNTRSPSASCGFSSFTENGYITANTYDVLDNVTQIAQGSSPQQQTRIQRKYSYDYDRFGNRWAQTLVAGSGFGGSNSFDYASNRVTSTGFSYDASGNITANGPGTSFTFNQENFITAASASNSYSVDTRGRRVKKTVSGVTTSYFYSGSVVISEKLGSAWTDYIFFGNQRIAQQTGSTLTVAKFLHQDHLGSTRVCTDGSGNSAGTCDYEPFGEFQPGSACSSLPTNYRFAGMYYDSESGLYYTWFRQYDANQGRWMGVDPLPRSPSNPQSLNRYDYARSDPANLVDPSGLDPGCGEGCHALYLKLGDNRRGPYLGCSCPGHVIQDVPGICTIVMKNGVVISNSCRGGEEIPRPDRPGGDPSSVLRDIKSAVCKAIPEGGTTGLSGGIGALGGQTGSIELVRNYSTGETSLFFSGGMQFGWNGGAQGSAFTGSIYNLGSSNRNYSGGFDTLSGGKYAVGSVSKSTSAGGPLVIAAGGGTSLIPTPTATYSRTQSSNPIPLGRFWTFSVTDWVLYALRQACK